MLLPVVKEPNPILHQKALTVTELTPEIKKLIDENLKRYLQGLLKQEPR